jgi:hypothetical protein
MRRRSMSDEGKRFMALRQGPDLDDGDKTIIHMAFDALLSRGIFGPLTEDALARVPNVSEKLGIHQEPLCCRLPGECPLLELWEEYEKAIATPQDEQ